MNLRRLDNPPNPYASQYVELLEPPPPARIEVYEETARSILSENDSPDLPFRWSVNPYRGCQHACAYCYARPYHEYLDLGAGTDFETKLVAKVNAPELLRDAFKKKGWRGEAVNFSGVTDCYQPLEASYELTRRCLEVCLAYDNPAMVVTKGFLVVRDADLLASLNEKVGSGVYLSIAFADQKDAKLFDPQAPPPERRFEAIRRLSEAGVPVGVMVGPVIPGLNDQAIPEILERSAKAGATSAAYLLLRLPGSVEEVFLKRLGELKPLRAKKVVSLLGAMRGGKLTDSRFGKRMRGQGAHWESIASMFSLYMKRYGLTKARALKSHERKASVREVPRDRQLNLKFED